MNTWLVFLCYIGWGEVIFLWILHLHSFNCRFASTTGFKFPPKSQEAQGTTGCLHWLKKHPCWASDMYCSLLNRCLTVQISTIFIFFLCFPSSHLAFRQLLSVRMTRTNRFYCHLPLLIPLLLLCPWIFPSLSLSFLLSSPLPPQLSSDLPPVRIWLS